MVVLRPFDESMFLDEVEGLYHDVKKNTLGFALPGHADLFIRDCHEVHVPVCDHDLDGLQGVDSLACGDRRRGVGAIPFFYSEVGLVFAFGFVLLVRTSSLGGRAVIRGEVAEDEAPGGHLGEVAFRFPVPSALAM